MMSPAAAAAVIGIERISLRRCFQRNDNLLSNTMFSTKVTSTVSIISGTPQ